MASGSQKFSGQFKVCLRVGTADPSAPLRCGRDDKLMQGIIDSPHSAHQLSAISCQPSAVSHQLSAISCQPSAISRQHSPITFVILSGGGLLLASGVEGPLSQRRRLVLAPEPKHPCNLSSRAKSRDLRFPSGASRTSLLNRWVSCWLLSASAVGATLSPQPLHSLTPNDRHHDQRRGSIGPPPSQPAVQQQSRQKNRRQVGAEVGLARIRV